MEVKQTALGPALRAPQARRGRNGFLRLSRRAEQQRDQAAGR
jgi:hypothetical protein